MPGLTDTANLLDSLPALQRLAMAYCPRHAISATLALLALDTRFASLLRHSREPMLAQMRFAWWRETLASDTGRWPSGDPLLTALRSWEGQYDALSTLAEGWEALTGSAPLPRAAMLQFAAARGVAFASLCTLVGSDRDAAMAARKGQAWAISDLALRLSDAMHGQVAMDLLATQDWSPGGLSRSLRPLALLHGMARRRVGRTGEEIDSGVFAMMAAIRLGLLGR